MSKEFFIKTMPNDNLKIVFGKTGKAIITSGSVTYRKNYRGETYVVIQEEGVLRLIDPDGNEFETLYYGIDGEVKRRQIAANE